MPQTEGRLPHLYEITHPLFVAFRLFDSPPKDRPFPNATVTTGQAFAAMNRLLAAASTGPTYLSQPEIAETVLRSTEHGVALKHCALHGWVIMPNHVHLLLTPHINV